MKCSCCGKIVRTTKEERDSFRALGFYTAQYFLQTDFFSREQLEANPKYKGDENGFFCFNCAYETESIELEKPDYPEEWVITLKRNEAIEAERKARREAKRKEAKA